MSWSPGMEFETTEAYAGRFRREMPSAVGRGLVHSVRRVPPPGAYVVERVEKREEEDDVRAVREALDEISSGEPSEGLIIIIRNLETNREYRVEDNSAFITHDIRMLPPQRGGEFRG